MAFGVPVVTTMAPFNTMANLLVNDSDAVLIPSPTDHKALAAALMRVCTDVDLRKTLTQNGRLFAQKYTWDEIKNKYYEIYRLAMSSASKSV